MHAMRVVHCQFLIELVIFMVAAITVTWQQAASYSEVEVVVDESKTEGGDDSEITCALSAGHPLHVVMLLAVVHQ